MAPPKKPAARRQRTQTADVGLVAVQVQEVPPPPHPDGRRLMQETVEAWETFWGSELASLVKPADLAPLTRLFRLYDMRARLERIVLGEPLVSGSQGQPRMNPAAAEVASLDGRIVALEDRFGLTPSARLKLGVTFGLAARSLEELNRAFDDEVPDEEDPRLRAIDVS